MKIALIGTGKIANVHAKELKRLGLTIDVAVNRHLAKAEAFADKWGVQKASDQFDDAFAEYIDAIHICTPPGRHYEFVKRAIESGKHVICEKPLTLSAEESAELVKLAEKSDKIVAINFNVRYHGSLDRVKDSVQSDDFGHIRLINASYMQSFHILPTAYSWRYDNTVPGNLRAISEIGSHVIDLIYYVTGQKIKAVSAVIENYVPTRYVKDGIMYEEEVESSEIIEVTNEDAAIVSFKLANGAIGNMTLSEISHGKTNEIKLHIDGSKKSTWWSNETPYHTYEGDRNVGTTVHVDSFGGGYNETISSFFEEVYGDIADGQRNGNYPTLADGYYNVVVCEAIKNSAMGESKWVDIKK